MSSPLAARRLDQIWEEVVWGKFDAHGRRRSQNAPHLRIRQGIIGGGLAGNRMRSNARSFGEARLRAEALLSRQVLNDRSDVSFIGHAAIISERPIIARADLSEADRYSVATMRDMHVGDRIKAARKDRGWTQAELGEAVGLKQPTVAEIEAGKLKSWPQHATAFMRALGKPRSYFEPDADEHVANTADLPLIDPVRAYVRVAVLPTYGGMGGGGTGEGDEEVALLPRSLVVEELRAQPSDLLVINVRGDSMEPRFQHGDQIVIDRRDTNPIQPGPFALWFDGGYVVKNVERIRKTGRLRIFSSNGAYSPDEAAPDEVQIMGRPVWFARRI